MNGLGQGGWSEGGLASQLRKTLGCGWGAWERHSKTRIPGEEEQLQPGGKAAGPPQAHTSTETCLCVAGEVNSCRVARGLREALHLGAGWHAHLGLAFVPRHCYILHPIVIMALPRLVMHCKAFLRNFTPAHYTAYDYLSPPPHSTTRQYPAKHHVASPRITPCRVRGFAGFTSLHIVVDRF